MDVRLVRAIGWLTILHGLLHAVLPMRGSLVPAAVIGDWTPVVLYAIATVGFVTAGLVGWPVCLAEHATPRV